MRFGRLWAEGETLPRTGNCTVEMIEPAKHETEVIESLGVFRFEIEGFVESGCSFAEAALMC